jgi:hypothetical protein
MTSNGCCFYLFSSEERPVISSQSIHPASPPTTVTNQIQVASTSTNDILTHENERSTGTEGTNTDANADDHMSTSGESLLPLKNIIETDAVVFFQSR